MEGIHLNIIIAGMTASGKSLFGRRLARQLGFGYVSASHILFERMNFPAEERYRAWSDHFEEIAKSRDGSELDVEVDRELVEISGQCDHLVIDSWALPWLVEKPALKLWISCDEQTRCKKARSADTRRDRKSLAYYRFILARKDEDFRQRLSNLYGFAYGPDPNVFDHVLDNTEYYVDPFSSLSGRMIEKFSDLLLSTVLNDMGLPIGAT